MTTLNDLFLILKGGPGSGHFGHFGIPGQTGGSVSRSLGVAADYKARQAVAKAIVKVLEYGQRIGNETMVGFDIDGNQINGMPEGNTNSIKDEDTNKILTNDTYVFVHNHPGSSSFSSPDIATFVTENPKHMVVVGHDGTIYKMSKPDGWESEYTWTHAVSISNNRMNNIREKYVKRAKNGENTNLLFKEHTHEANTETAKELGLQYERVLP